MGMIPHECKQIDLKFNHSKSKLKCFLLLCTPLFSTAIRKNPKKALYNFNFIYWECPHKVITILCRSQFHYIP